MAIPHRRLSLAQRGAELQALGWPTSKVEYWQGREMRFSFSMAPTPMSRSYRCLLKVPRSGFPEMIVLEPDLKLLASGRPIPHVYPYNNKGTKLCLWLPGSGEWNSNMRFEETYLPWTAEWLDYFEEWLETDTWAGGGAHPEPHSSKKNLGKKPIDRDS